MQLEHTFTVAAPVEQAWALLLDIERIAPCMPGATLTSFSGDNFEGNVRVKLGPVNMTYAGKGRFLEKDEAAHRMVMEASGRDARGGGTAKATVTGTLKAADDGAGTVVTVVTDLAVTGRPAQFGRGMIADVGGRLIGQFADCLASKLSELPAPEPTPAEPAPAQEPETGEPASVVEPAAVVAEPAAAVSLAPVKVTPAAEPIDLLHVTGVSGAVKRAVPYVVGFVLGGLVTWLLLTLLT